MDFSVEFIALCDRMEQGQDRVFASRRNAAVAGRMAALVSEMNMTEERKILGIMSTGMTSHAHEYRLLFAAPTLDAAGLADWWRYALDAEQALVQADERHSFSLVSVVLVAERVEKEAAKRLKRLSAERKYGANGWSSIRFAVVEIGGGKVYTNREGETLRGILLPFLQKNT